ncbi:hypothetical protein Bca4012_069053 [Brassica carinata]
MATDSVKHVPTLGGTSISTEMKSFFSAVKPIKIIINFVCASFITFVAFTVYVAFTTFEHSVSSYILPNVTTTNTTSRAPSLTPPTFESPAANEANPLSRNNASRSRTDHASVHLCPNNNTHARNNSDKLRAPLSVNLSASPMRKQSRKKSWTKREINSLKKCEFFEGEWVKDDSYPLYKPGTCTLIDKQFDCMTNGRPDEYNCTVEFFASPFLVREWEVKDKNGRKKKTLRLDMMGKTSKQYKGADVLVFNTGSWWTHDKTSKGEDYYQEGSNVHPKLDVDEAFRKALTTWGRWVDKNVNPKKSLVFFRGYSTVHFSGGQWNAGGACDDETEPIKNETYLTPYPSKMEILERVLRGMKTPVTYLNITRLTDYRKDAHPSVYRKQKFTAEESKSPLLYQDCSHWCLPGVPDSWNEILYAEMLVKLDQLRGNRPTAET